MKEKIKMTQIQVLNEKQTSEQIIREVINTKQTLDMHKCELININTQQKINANQINIIGYECKQSIEQSTKEHCVTRQKIEKLERERGMQLIDYNKMIYRQMIEQQNAEILKRYINTGMQYVQQQLFNQQITYTKEKDMVTK